MGSKGSILIDLDETLHDSTHLKAVTWQHILKGMGYNKWEKTCEAEPGEGELPGVLKELHPERGLAPPEFIRQLLVNLELFADSIDTRRLRETGFQDKNIIALLQLQESTPTHPIPNELISILQDEWTFRLAQTVEELGINPIEGTPEMVKRLHDAGYKIGVVTQAPQKYAREVLKCLGLWTTNCDERIVDVIVSGEMVRKPKPDPEPLMLANWFLGWKEQLACARAQKGSSLARKEKEELVRTWWKESISNQRPRAYVGDSLPDVEAGVAFRIPVIIIQGEDTDPAWLKELGASLVVECPDEVTPEIFQREPFLNFPSEGKLDVNPPFRFKEG